MYLLNRLVLQWFGLRLCTRWSSSGEYLGWGLLYGVRPGAHWASSPNALIDYRGMLHL